MPMAGLIGGGIGALGSLGSGLLGYFGSQNATSKSLGLQGQGLQALQSILGPLLSQGSGIVNSALGPLTKLLTPGADQTATLNQMPGFQFAQNWGQQAVKNSGTTMGLGGNTLAAGANYATGLAQQGYGQIVSQLKGFLDSGIGLESSAGTALAGGTAGIFGNMGNTAGAGAMGQANALAGGVSGALGSAGNAFTLSQLISKFSGQGAKPGGIYGTQNGLQYSDSGEPIATPSYS